MNVSYDQASTLRSAAMSFDSAPVFRNALHHYELTIEVLEGVTQYLANASTIVGSCADLLANPQRLKDQSDPLRNTLWFDAQDINVLLAQWRACVADAWAAWSALPGAQQALVTPPRFDIVTNDAKILRQR
jgi:hypothetical protein